MVQSFSYLFSFTPADDVQRPRSYPPLRFMQIVSGLKSPFDLKTGGLWKKIFRMLLKLARTAQLLTPFLIKLVFWLQILGNGADSNRKLEINSNQLKSKF
jgi:hypothetical protein